MRRAVGVLAATAFASCGRVAFDELNDGRAAADAPDSLAPCAESPGLAAYLPFDEAVGAIAGDYSKSAQTGDLRAGTSWAAGKIGGAIEFDGIAGLVELRQTTGMSFGTGSFSLSYWLRPATLRSARPFELAYCPAPAYVFAYLEPDGTTGFAGVDAATVYAGATSPPAAVGAGIWTHVAYVIDRPADMALTYINGVPAGPAASIATWSSGFDCTATTLAANIGGFGGQLYAGLIDDLRVYTRALSASEVQTLAQLSASSCPF